MLKNGITDFYECGPMKQLKASVSNAFNDPVSVSRGRGAGGAGGGGWSSWFTEPESIRLGQKVYIIGVLEIG